MTALEDLTLYESTAVAHQSLKDEPGLALRGIKDYYSKSVKGTRLEKDSAINHAMGRLYEDAEVGIAEEGIFGSGILMRSIKQHAIEYENTFNSTKVSELLGYLTDGFKVSDEVKAGLGAYADLTLSDLGKKLKDKENPPSEEEKKSIENAVTALTLLKSGRLRRAGNSIYEGMIKEELGEMYPKPKAPAE